MAGADDRRRLKITGLMRDVLIELNGLHCQIHSPPYRPNAYGQKE